DHPKRLRPADRLIMLAPAKQHHWMRDASLLAEPLLGVACEIVNRMLREKFRPDLPVGRFPRDCLGAVLAELRRMSRAVRIWPGAAWTIKATLVVYNRQGNRVSSGAFTDGVNKRLLDRMKSCGDDIALRLFRDLAINRILRVRRPHALRRCGHGGFFGDRL